MTPKARPLPVISTAEKPYWEYLRRHEFRLQRCADCAAMRFPVGPRCPECGCAEFRWDRATGKGTVFSWVVFHKSYFPAFDNAVPYNVVMVRLEEGPMFIANITGSPNSEIRKGVRVEMIFDDVTPDVTIPRFRLEAHTPTSP